MARITEKLKDVIIKTNFWSVNQKNSVIKATKCCELLKNYCGGIFLWTL